MYFINQPTNNDTVSKSVLCIQNIYSNLSDSILVINLLYFEFYINENEISSSNSFLCLFFNSFGYSFSSYICNLILCTYNFSYYKYNFSI